MTYKNTVALWGGGETAGGYQLMTPISLGGGGNQCDTIDNFLECFISFNVV